VGATRDHPAAVLDDDPRADQAGQAAGECGERDARGAGEARAGGDRRVPEEVQG